MPPFSLYLMHEVHGMIHMRAYRVVARKGRLIFLRFTSPKCAPPLSPITEARRSQESLPTASSSSTSTPFPSHPSSLPTPSNLPKYHHHAFPLPTPYPLPLLLLSPSNPLPCLCLPTASSPIPPTYAPAQKPRKTHKRARSQPFRTQT